MKLNTFCISQDESRLMLLEVDRHGKVAADHLESGISESCVIIHYYTTRCKH